ncbi:MAG: hypothetical protein U5N58_06700 [Actinomycetota bacterium]|nr:hypothetical protein [Actinomycetota bacterium]
MGNTAQQDDDGSITVDKSGLVGSDTAISTLTGTPERHNIDPAIVTLDNDGDDGTYPSSHTWEIRCPLEDYTLLT